MAVTPKRAQTLALALENASSYPHFDRIAFRTPRRTFATLALSGVDMNFKLELAQQAQFCKLAPHAMAPVPGGWGRMGFTRCELKKIDAATFLKALQTAHASANASKAKVVKKTKVPKQVSSAAKSSQKKPPRG